MQRHNELLQVVKNAPSEIGDIVARRRKDFTQEFFLHLHAVAESYHDNEVEQNGETQIFVIPLKPLMLNCLFLMS